MGWLLAGEDIPIDLSLSVDLKEMDKDKQQAKHNKILWEKQPSNCSLVSNAGEGKRAFDDTFKHTTAPTQRKN